MAASRGKSLSKSATTAGFVLGANWQRSESEPASPQSEPAQPRNAVDIFQGIITHYVAPDLRPRLKQSGDSLLLIEDLGLDSLDMMEVMLRVEDLLKIRVTDNELRHFRTLGEVRQFIYRNTRTMAAALPSS